MNLPSIPGELFHGLALREHVGEGSLGDVKFTITSTAGLGSMSFFIEVEKPSGKRDGKTKNIKVRYSFHEYIKQIVQTIIDADWKDLEEKK